MVSYMSAGWIASAMLSTLLGAYVPLYWYLCRAGRGTSSSRNLKQFAASNYVGALGYNLKRSQRPYKGEI